MTESINQAQRAMDTPLDRISVVAAINRHVEGMIPYLTSRSSLLPRHYAACALARCNRLVSAMFIMRDSGYLEPLGLLSRSILEIWYLGRYLLLAPEEGLKMINAAHVHQIDLLDESWGDLAYVRAGLNVDKSAPIKWNQLAKEIDALASPTGESDTAVRMYEVLYRGESMMSTHGGLATLDAYSDTFGKGSLKVNAEPRTPDDGTIEIVVAGSMLVTLAREVAVSFGLSTYEIDKLGNDFDAAQAPDAPGRDQAARR
jgi:hypothetical protein